jgi:hypothetical protein
MVVGLRMALGDLVGGGGSGKGEGKNQVKRTN